MNFDIHRDEAVRLDDVADFAPQYLDGIGREIASNLVVVRFSQFNIQFDSIQSPIFLKRDLIMGFQFRQ